MKFTKSIVGVIAGFGAVGLIASGCSGVVSEDVRTVPVSVPRSEGHSLSLAMKNWADQIEDATDGELIFEFNYDSALCPAGDAVSCIGSGRAGAGQTSPAWEPAKFPLTRVGEAGFVPADVAATTAAVNQLAAETAEITAEFDTQNQKLLFLAVMNPLVAATPNKLETLAGLNNLSLRSSGSWPKIIEPLGVSPIAMPQTEQYEGVQRGVIDGVISTLDGSLEGSLFEVAPYYSAIGEYVGSTTLSAFTMNLDVYNSLTDEQRTAVDAASADLVTTWYSDFQKPEDERVCEGLLENGATVSTIGSAEEAAPWLAAAQSASDAAWKAEAAPLIDSPDDLLQSFRSLVVANARASGSGPVNGVQSCIK